MSAARIDVNGKPTGLDGKAGPDEVVTEEDVQDPSKLSRLLARLLKDVAALKRRLEPRRIDFEDIATPAGSLPITLQHNFRGRVRWWVVDWSDSAGTRWNIYKDTTNTTADTLVLTSQVVGIATIRVEAA